MPGDPDPYSDELMPSGKKGKGFIVLVFLVLAALAGGLIYMFRDTEQTTNAPETGRVLIKSVPSGADVYFNDARLPSQTPTEVARVEPNVEHTLKVTLPSLPAWEKKFTLTDTTKPLKFTAVLSEEEAEKVRMSGKPIIAGVPGKGKGSIRIVSKPRKALVYFDGIDTRKRTPVTLRGVSAGLDHVVMLEKNGFKPTYERLHLEDGEEKKVDLALDKGADNLSGRILVHVESEPEGASVKVNDYPLRNKTPMAVKLLVKGASDLEVDLKGYKPFSVKVRPVPGVDLTFFAKLRK